MSTEFYQQLVANVDELTAQLNQKYQSHLLCGAGCSGCCQHHLSIFPVEAVFVQKAVQDLPLQTQQRIKEQARATVANEATGQSVRCPMLIDDQCSIYESRPLICRTQGLPLLYEADDGAQEIDFCPLNFSSDAAIADLDDQALVPLDLLNLKLAMANVQYCQGQPDLEPHHRIKMATLCLEQAKSADEI